MPNHKAKKKGASTGNEQSNPGGSYKVSGSRNHEGNPVMEKKHDGSWRMCVDFTDLNKCLQGIPLNTDGGGRRGKTAFHTNQGVFCYTKISFGLKNAGATYQRLVDKAFVKQIGGNLEVYVDDLVCTKERLPVDTRSGKGIPKHEKMYSGAANGNRTKTQRGADNVSLRSQGSNGSSCLEGSGARLILTSPKGEEFTYALRFEFDASNNEAEYEALVAGLRIAEKIGVKNLAAKIDSRLVANEINGLYEAKEQSMTQYLEKTKTLINSFEIFSIEQVPRSENKKVDALSKIASTSFAHLTKQVLVETLKRKSIEEREILAVVEEEEHC
ncbi:reverse transcriptase domain-containing protein [Tanacetum coccineum]